MRQNVKTNVFIWLSLYGRCRYSKGSVFSMCNVCNIVVRLG